METTFTETVFGVCPDQALSADHQKRLLSKYLIDDDDDDGGNGLRPASKNRPAGVRLADNSVTLAQ